RPASLARCLNTALRTLTTGDILSVLDDSSERMLLANANVISTVAQNSKSPICHLRKNDLCSAIPLPALEANGLWLSKTAPRDIAPLRKLELMLSRAVSAITTILIDDDIHSFDLSATHHFMEDQKVGKTGIITGATICGMSEMDT